MSLVTVLSGKQLSGEFICVGEAAALIEKNEGAPGMQSGGMSMRLMNCDRRGQIILVEGGSGEFAVIKH